MYRISIEPHWHITHVNGSVSDATLDTVMLLRLLADIQSTGSIASAVKLSKLSYRHVWGLLRSAEQLFGAELLVKQPGRGTRLSRLAETLLWADKRIKARLTPTMESLASELENELDKTMSVARTALRLFASHGFAVASLLERINAEKIPLELRYRNSMEAVAALAGRECDLAGFHVPLGEFEAAAVGRYARWLDPDKHLLIHLAVRNQGLFVLPGNPKQISTLADLVRPGIRFVNRPHGSGTRMLVELMLEKARIPSAQINGFESAEFTHAAVAAYIASDMADVGIGVETAARRFGLDFVPLLRERYFFAIEKNTLDTAPMAQLIAILKGAGFREQVEQLAGYDVTEAGSVMSIQQAFGKVQLFDRDQA